MQTNESTSSGGREKSEISLDSIINEYNTKEPILEKKSDIEDAKKKLDELLKEQNDDLAWLDSIISGTADDKAVQEISDAENEENAAYEELVAENAENRENKDKEIAENKEIENVPEEENAQDSKTKLFDKVKQPDDGAIVFDIFENDIAQAEEVQADDEELFSADYDEKNAQTADSEEAPDKVDEFLGTLFGVSENGDDDIVGEKEEKPKEKKEKTQGHKKIAGELGGYEEINMADTAAVNAGQNRYYIKKCKALISLFGAALFLLTGLYVELAPLASLAHPKILSPENPALYAMIDLQIMFFGVMCVLDSLVSGFYAMTDKRFSPASCSLAVVAVCAVSAVLSAILCSSGAYDIKLFCSAGLLSVFMLALHDYLRASADDKAFRIASSTSSKFGAYELSTDSDECAPFAAHIDLENAKVISVKKGSVYEGFVERNQRRPAGEKKLGLMCGIIGIASLVIGAFMAVAEGLYAGISSAVIMFVSCVPINVFFVCALPKYLAARKGKQTSAALIGQNASEEYKGLSVVAFEDTEVFLPKDVRISSIKTYSGMALDEAVVLMSKIYEKLGGPLSKIFAKMVDIKSENVSFELRKVYPDAIEVNVDGKNITLATASYLGANGIRIITDSVDAAFEQSHGSILFMTSGGRIVAKFYIKYAVNPNFERTLAELHEAGLCVGIKTLDPCINNDLVFGCLEKANYALSVIKGTGAKDIPAVCEKVNSGVIALGSVHNFLEMLLLCERTGRNVKINNVIKLISMVVCILLSAAFIFTNSSLNVIFCLIIQLFWLIPVTVISYFNK